MVGGTAGGTASGNGGNPAVGGKMEELVEGGTVTGIGLIVDPVVNVTLPDAMLVLVLPDTTLWGADG